jgi:hypothetical protein
MNEHGVAGGGAPGVENEMDQFSSWQCNALTTEKEMDQTNKKNTKFADAMRNEGNSKHRSRSAML